MPGNDVAFGGIGIFVGYWRISHWFLPRYDAIKVPTGKVTRLTDSTNDEGRWVVPATGADVHGKVLADWLLLPTPTTTSYFLPRISSPAAMRNALLSPFRLVTFLVLRSSSATASSMLTPAFAARTIAK